MLNIKKFLLGALACIMGSMIMCTSASAVSGDVNFDGIFDINDATVIQLHLALTTRLSDEQLSAAELNGDGIVDINDVTYIQQKLAGYNVDGWGAATKPTDNSEPTQDPKSDFDKTVQGQIFKIVNEERAKAGAAPLAYDEKLAGCAQIRANEIVESFSHTRPDGTSCFTVVPASDGYLELGENIASGYTSAEKVMDGWMNSEGHRANILKTSYTNIGIGYVTANGNQYYVQLFGTVR